jgi:hypothetical protein
MTPQEIICCALIPVVILGIIRVYDEAASLTISLPLEEEEEDSRRFASSSEDIVIEGFNIGKEIGKAFKKPIDTIKKPIDDVKKKTNETVDSLKEVVNSVAKIGTFLGAVFIAIGSYLECGGFFIKNIFSYCIIYYLLYITMLIIYAPFALLFWATSTQSLENAVWGFGKSIHDFVEDFTGMDMMQYIVPDNCYKCNIKPIPKFK